MNSTYERHVAEAVEVMARLMQNGSEYATALGQSAARLIVRAEDVAALAASPELRAQWRPCFLPSAPAA